MIPLLIALLLAPPPPERALPYTPQTTALANGLQVVTVKTPVEGIMMYVTVVRTGSRDEVEAGRSGYAHFFEHMMFRGTPTWSGRAWGAKMASHGADTNAYTTNDYTAYFAVGPTQALDDVIALEADRFQHIAYTEADFRTEAGAVLGEYNKAAAAPWLKMYERQSALAFEKHTYGHTVIGYLADIKAMPDGFEYARSFFDRFYTPDNTTILVVGDVDHAAVTAKVKAAYGGWKGKKVEPKVPFEPPQGAPRRAHVEWPTTTARRIWVSWKVPALNPSQPDAGAVQVAAELLFGKTSPVYRELVLETQQVTRLEASADWRRDPQLVTVAVELKDGADAAAVEARLVKAAADAAQGVDAARLAAVKSNVRYGSLMQLSSLSAVGHAYTEFIGVTGDPDAGEANLRQIAAVDAAAVQAVVAKYFNDARRTTITLAPKGEQ